MVCTYGFSCKDIGKIRGVRRVNMIRMPRCTRQIAGHSVIFKLYPLTSHPVKSGAIIFINLSGLTTNAPAEYAPRSSAQIRRHRRCFGRLLTRQCVRGWWPGGAAMHLSLCECPPCVHLSLYRSPCCPFYCSWSPAGESAFRTCSFLTILLQSIISRERQSLQQRSTGPGTKLYDDKEQGVCVSYPTRECNKLHCKVL